MKPKKVREKLRTRRMAYARMISKMTDARAAGFTKPGSQNPSKR